MYGAYFNYLISKIGTHRSAAHSKLLNYLADREFKWSMPIDENRATDGIDLRLKYIDESAEPCEISDRDFTKTDEFLAWSRTYYCSWLEMLTALAIRCEDVMAEYHQNNVNFWFWLIIDNVFDVNMSNSRFDQEECDKELDQIERHIKSLSFGKISPDNEIWAQAMAILNDFVSKNS